MENEKAFTTLYRLYWSKVYNFSRLYLSSITEVEEVVQEVFVKVWETRDFLRADDNFKGYLFIITRNLIFNQFRKSFNENAYKLTVLSAAMDYYDMEDELSAADLKEFIKRMVGELPPRQQEVFKMSRDEHLTYKEIATRLNISEKTVERHINEAIKFLKKNIMLLSDFYLLNNHSLIFFSKNVSLHWGYVIFLACIYSKYRGNLWMNFRRVSNKG